MFDQHYALLYLKRNPFKAIISFLIFFVVANIIIVITYLNLSTNKLTASLYDNIEYSISFEGNIFDTAAYSFDHDINKNIKEIQASDEELLASGLVEKIDYHFGVDGYIKNFFLMDEAYPDITYYERALVYGSFDDVDLKLVEGNLSDLENGAIIPEGAFYLEGDERVPYKLGDTLNFEAPVLVNSYFEDEIRETTNFPLKVVGIYDPLENESDDDYRFSERIYVANEKALEYYDLLYQNYQKAKDQALASDLESFESDAKTLNAKFYYYHIDAKDYDSLVELIDKTNSLAIRLSYKVGDIIRNEYSVISSLDEANKVKNTIDSMQLSINLTLVLLVVLILAGMSFILQLFLKDRLLEMGVNMSLGRYKRSLFSQYLLENTLVLGIAFILAQFSAYYLSAFFIDILRNASNAKQLEILESSMNTDVAILDKVNALLSAYEIDFSLAMFGLSFVLVFVITLLTTSLNFLRVRRFDLVDILKKTG